MHPVGTGHDLSTARVAIANDNYKMEIPMANRGFKITIGIGGLYEFVVSRVRTGRDLSLRNGPSRFAIGICNHDDMNLKLWFVIVICNHVGTGRDLSTARKAIANGHYK